MKTLLLSASILCMLGCEKEITPTLSTVSNNLNTSEYSIKLSDYPNAKSDFSLVHEFEYVAAETYGAIAFKVMDACYIKYSSMLDGIDMSSDYGAVKLNDYNFTVSKCTTDTLINYPEIPIDMRSTIPRENIGLELNESEIESFDEMPIAEYDKNSSRYKELRKICEENNSNSSKSEFESNVEFCVPKAM